MNQVSRSVNSNGRPIDTKTMKLWKQTDLFFLRDAVQRGMHRAKIAGFLGRTEAEVRQKSRALRLGKRK